VDHLRPDPQPCTTVGELVVWAVRVLLQACVCARKHVGMCTRLLLDMDGSSMRTVAVMEQRA